MLTPVAADLWTAEQTLRLPGGVLMPLRMNIVRLASGGLLVHSPMELSGPLAEAISALGPVEVLLAPSLLHHRFAGDWKQRFPAARLHGAPGLGRKRPDLAVDGELGEAGELGGFGSSGTAAWQTVLDQVLLAGAPKLGEMAFLHRPSGTLLVTDLLFNIRTPRNFQTGLLLRFTGTRGHLAMSRVWRACTRDRAAFAASVNRVLGWSFTRILPAHGDMIEAPDARAQAREALAWAVGRASAKTEVSTPAH